LALSYGWRGVRQRRVIGAIVAPLIPAVMLATLVQQLGGQTGHDPLAWTVEFWLTNGPGMVGVVLSRFAGACTTIGLFTLPLTLPLLFDGRIRAYSSVQRWLATALLLALVAGLVARSAVFDESWLFPHVGNVIRTNGFMASPFNDRLPESIVIPRGGLVAVTVASLLGAVALLLAVAGLDRAKLARRGSSVPLLFALLAAGQTLAYYTYLDRYLLAALPAALLVALLVKPRTRLAIPLAVAGLGVLAVWSVWWESEYLARRAAQWQAAQAVVERGVPPQEVNGGFEWNRWYRGPEVIAAAVQLARAERSDRPIDERIGEHLKTKDRWSLMYRLPRDIPANRVLATVPYWNGHSIYAVQRS
jgi:hypothetical protein